MKTHSSNQRKSAGKARFWMDMNRENTKYQIMGGVLIRDETDEYLDWYLQFDIAHPSEMTGMRLPPIG